MSRTHHVIAVPGIGDHRHLGDATALKLLWLFGLRTHYHRMCWAYGESFEPKFTALLAQIDDLTAKGNTVSLIGYSAGATAVMNAYAARQDVITSVVLVSGKIQRPQTIGAAVRRINPAFTESALMVAASLKQLPAAKRERIMSIHPIADNVVDIKDTIIEGALERQIPVKGHLVAIGYSLTFGTPMVAAWIKSHAATNHPK